MSLSRLVLSGVVLGAVLGGCAKPPAEHNLASQYVATPQVTNAILQSSTAMTDQPMPKRIFSNGNLGGRTLAVGSTSEIVLKPGEVVLTFDDGPRPSKTPQVLETLDQFGVKATFLMLGAAAQAHPQLAQQVALHGHTVGSHTYDHVDLNLLTSQEALAEISRGEIAVAEALAGSGKSVSPFFRFPYLSQSGFLRTNLIQGNMVVLDVDIDSKDYYKESAAMVTERTLERLEAQGSGIILFHDIHERTVELLPNFLAELEQRGYSVVRLVPKANGIFGRDVITAGVPEAGAAL